MQSLLRMLLVLLATAVAVAVGVSCTLVLLIHFMSGSSSFGILAVAKSGLRYWVPLVFALTALWFFGTCARIVLLARRRASSAGIPLLQYFDLGPVQKAQLLEGPRENK